MILYEHDVNYYISVSCNYIFCEIVSLAIKINLHGKTAQREDLE